MVSRTNLEKIIDTITTPSKRDKQTKIGPSALGKQCEICLAELLLGKTPERSFSLYPWIGTSVHLWLEQFETGAGIHKEISGPVGEIAGYGTIKGSCDRYDENLKEATDYKVVGKNSRRRLSKGYIQTPQGIEFLEPSLLEYYIQINSYGVMLVNQGYDVDVVSLCLIPRDSSTVRDIQLLQFGFDPDIVYAYLERAAAIYAYAEKHGLEGLEEHPECWNH